MLHPGRRPSAHRVLVHPDVFEGLEGHDDDNIARRVGLALRSLVVTGRTGVVKRTRGVNAEWSRTPAGGNGGNHFYLWHRAAHDAQGRPVRVVRALRHHDDHDRLNTDDLAGYLRWPEDDDGIALPIATPRQRRFVELPAAVRVLRGSPGTGKTTALIEAITAHGAPRVLVVAASRTLVRVLTEQLGVADGPGLARPDQDVRVVTPEVLVGQVLGRDILRPGRAERAAFGVAVEALELSTAQLKGWKRRGTDAHDALRVACWGAAPADARTPPVDAYLASLDKGARRERLVVEKLRDLERVTFADLLAAREALATLREQGPEAVDAFGLIVVDEVQDLTPVELTLLVELARDSGAHLILCGDESQTITPSGFRFDALNEIVRRAGLVPEMSALDENLRNPQQIHELLRRVEGLYRQLDKSARPRGAHAARASSGEKATVLRCHVPHGGGLGGAIAELANVPDVAVVSLENLDPALLGDLPHEAAEALRTPIDVKGLEFDVVLALGMGAVLCDAAERDAVADDEAADLRLDIDRLRVVLSRAQSLLIVVETTEQGDQAVAEYIDGDSVPLESALHHALAERSDPNDIVVGLIRRARDEAARRPTVAWQAARDARGLAERHHADVYDETLEEAARCVLETGWSLLMVPSVPVEPHELAQHTVQAARAVGLDAFAQALERFAAPLGEGAAPSGEALLRLVFGVAPATPSSERTWVLQGLAPRRQLLLDRLSVLELNADPELATVALSDVLVLLGQGRADADERATRSLEAVLRRALNTHDYGTALVVADRLEPRRDREAARALVGLKRFGEAVVRLAGRHDAEVLDALRALGQVSHALQVAACDPDPSDATLLRWLLETTGRLEVERGRLTEREAALFDVRNVDAVRRSLERAEQATSEQARSCAAQQMALAERDAELSTRAEVLRVRAEELSRARIALGAMRGEVEAQHAAFGSRERELAATAGRLEAEQQTIQQLGDELSARERQLALDRADVEARLAAVVRRERGLDELEQALIAQAKAEYAEQLAALRAGQTEHERLVAAAAAREQVLTERERRLAAGERSLAEGERRLQANHEKFAARQQAAPPPAPPAMGTSPWVLSSEWGLKRPAMEALVAEVLGRTAPWDKPLTGAETARVLDRLRSGG